jgi:pyruvate dehydrogenase E1 component, alpha subunit
VTRFEIPYYQFLAPDGRLADDAPPPAGDIDRLRALYTLMVRTRALDRKAVALQRTGRLGTYVSGLGQEATGASIGLTLGEHDVFIPAYREYGAQFARGVTMRELLLYWSGDERGSAYATDGPARLDFPLSIPIGSHVPQAVGVGYALRLQGGQRAVLVSCGDGATSKGDFYEALNGAGVWQLPVVFLVSNNQWAISLPRSRQSAAATLAQKAIAAGIPGEQVDGNDAVALTARLDAALARARRGEGPTLIEAITYRIHDHTTADDARRYRDEAEVAAALETCPVLRLRRHLEAIGAWDAQHESALLDAAAAEVEQAVADYLATPPEPPEAMFDSLYAELPASCAAQREEVVQRGPARQEDHH